MNIFKKKSYEENGIVKFEIKDSIVKKVIDFYNESPFPNYENNDDKSSINYKGENNFIAKKTKEFIGFNKTILEVGCGTGQLSLYLAIGSNNKVIAFDPALESIKLGKDFSEKNNIKNIKFVNADIFDDVLEKNVFDLPTLLFFHS